jgi:sigma-B regulation protein RsbU (phosphoserine phosphatase)
MKFLPISEITDRNLDNQIELLATIGWDFAEAAELGPTLQNAIRRTLEYLDAEAGSIFLLDDATRMLECQACAGPLDISGLKLECGQGIVGRTVDTGCLQMVRDVAQDGGFNSAVDGQTGFVTRSILCAPLQVRGAPLGALEVINKKSADGLFSQADANLLTALAALVALAIHNARMAGSLVVQERMRKELELAGEIQRSLLPADPGEHYPVHGINVPALEMSGDFYHFFELADGRICFCLGDVSGKGMNASLLMAKTISLFQCLAKTILEPAALLAAINAELVETAIHGMFVSMVAGIYDPVRRHAVFANAGHQPPLFRDGQGAFREIEALEPPLGILPDIAFSEHRQQLDAGSLYVFTDGLTEGRLKDGGQLGAARAFELIGQLAHLPQARRLQELVAHLQDTGEALHDDVTVLVVGS